MIDRPGGHKYRCSTPSDILILELMGGHHSNGMTYTHDQMGRLLSIYGYDPERTEREADEAYAAAEEARRNDDSPPNPFKARPATRDEIVRYYETGAHVNIMKYVASDGQRLMGVMAKYLEPGEDPVKLLLRLMAQAGYDVDALDLEWAHEEDPEEDEE